MKIARRKLLTAGAALVALGAPVPWLLNRSARARAEGPGLVPDPRGLCDLPRGFRYRVIDRAGDTLSDGFRVPGRPDGMACFTDPNGSWVLLRNHELDRGGSSFDGPPPAEIYDARASGGVTRVVIDPKRRERVSSNLVLAGTLRNCAGGPSPWGWLSCEESVERGHGYVFRCPVDADRLRRAEKIAGYGRFFHEAVCVDPKTHVAYLTEDRADGCLYRFKPIAFDRPFEGKLEALRVLRAPGFETATAIPAGQRVECGWVEIPEPDPEDDSVRLQARERGAALIRRGEGMWFHDGAVYVCATAGGKRGAGQILRLSLGGAGGRDALEVFAEATDPSVLDMPDNITVAPWGDVYVAEDGSGGQFVRGLTPKGRVFDVARNAASSGEFAGVCFSPDGSTLFFNLQADGVTLAVDGPFRSLSS